MGKGPEAKSILFSRLVPLPFAPLRSLSCDDDETVVFDADGFNLRWKLKFISVNWASQMIEGRCCRGSMMEWVLRQS
jgi:hypothetical protein